MDQLTTTHPDYLKLARRFAPRPLRSAAEHARAMTVLLPLMGRADAGLSEGESDYVDAMVPFVEDWEANRYAFKAAKMTPLAAMRYLMSENGLTVGGLAKAIGSSHAAASMIVGGKREISKAAARKLADRFKVDVGLFIGRSALDGFLMVARRVDLIWFDFARKDMNPTVSSGGTRG